MRNGFTRRHFLVAVSGTALAGCAGASMPKVGDGPPRVSMRTGLQLGTAPVKGPDVKFAVIGITGAPGEKALMMERAIAAQAKIRKLTIVPEGSPAATYTVKGYLSAIGDRGGTLLVHVWDVLDTTGRRLHRYSGQETSRGTESDPWLGIDEGTIVEAASRMVDDLADWVA